MQGLGTLEHARGLRHAASWLQASLAAACDPRRTPCRLSAADIADVAAALRRGVLWLAGGRGGSPSEQAQYTDVIKYSVDIAEALVPVLLQQIGTDGQDEHMVRLCCKARHFVGD